ncbi:neutral/alkaline ceramidase [candidate division KSB1 bacterium]|nr:neutral/alkaline ceramidase [candidate division KSB1 bacterium]NIR69327.1 neutral/alkaline ceramidase [candidate division KSB1 bacterium]NIS24148.1 neutral/alkaline ceramidase [candidate division KSB1 bacterium]NIT71062.1 neutral/alkaline ceramidase [candidate division KSB1 bacterium]NIU24767.1 neutral/alkaline ceramidase [candidate division KSB1 bacterium]
MRKIRNGRRILIICCLGSLLLSCKQSKQPQVIDSDCAGNTKFLIGCGIYDITGPGAERGMLGYGMMDQTTAGIHMRLRSRAFVIASPCNEQRVVFVSADLGLLFQGVKQTVVEKLQQTYGDLYSDANVLLSATHTHSGPGGYSHYTLYNLTTFGFDPQNFEAIVEGIYQSIVRAHENLAPGTIAIATGELLNAGINRSSEAYNRNPESERRQYAYDTDKTMTLLKLMDSAGHDIGMINWFAVHATSMGNDNHLVSGDNKGYASYLFEKLKDADYTEKKTFVAAFAQSNEGDVSPNITDGSDGGGADDFESTAISGSKQYEKAVELYDQANELLIGGIHYRHTYVDFSNVTVEPQWTDGDSSYTTCPAAIGKSMIAGTEDGRGFGKEGWTLTEVQNQWGVFLANPVRSPCQGEKPIVLETGTKKPFPWTPQILPIQIVTIGDLALLAVPAEFTTMAGRRLRKTVTKGLKEFGIKYVVIAGLSNGYGGYVTTKEAYDAQHYEGASTHFGPWTLAAYQQEFHRLAVALKQDTSVAPGPTPPDLSDHQIDAQPGVVYDGKPVSKEFGSLYTDADSAYKRSETVKAVFWGGHPRNDLKIQSTFLEAQMRQDTAWVTIARDWDPETRYMWQRDACPPTFSCSLVTIQWTIPTNASPGTYRIRHAGNWKSALDGRIRAYSGLSREFRVY